MVDLNVQHKNLAGAFAYKEDGNLRDEAPTPGPTLLVVGTAAQGIGSNFYRVTTTAQAKVEFGTEGDLLRGMWEARSMGADEVALYRIGAKSAYVYGIGNSGGGAGGYIIQTYEQDADAGGNYAFYYDDSEDRLVVKRNSDDLIVYDNVGEIDLFEVIVSGYRASGGGPDIGSPSSFVDLEAVDPSAYAGTSFVAGVDGLSLSKMERYEALYVAYENLMHSNFDVIVPMDVYLDDHNVVDQGPYIGAVAPEITTPNTYPTAGVFKPGVEVDALGKLFVEEYEGIQYFWWWFNDGSGTFTAADIYPTDAPGSATSSTKIDGTTLTKDDFHEVNFAYQLGRFLYEYSTNIVDSTGVIGTLPPASNSLVDKARWAGRAPTWTLDATTGLNYIASSTDNGSGLIGNKFLVGRYDHRSGLEGGGLMATDTKFMDDTEIKDKNDEPVDLGRYLSVTPDYPLLRNDFSPTSYLASFAACYGGFYINRNPASATTNKQVSNTTILYKLGLKVLDDLAGARYTILRQKTTGLVIGDAPTASRAISDWNRLSTVRIVKEVIDAARLASDRFIGEGMSSTNRQSLQLAIENVLMTAKKAGYLQDFAPFQIIQTPSMEVQGKAEVNLTLKPAFELRQITFSISLSKSL